MNPFVFGRIVTGENFYDRVEECKRIAGTLSGGNNIVLYAPRRYGKTSLVFKVIEELEKKNFICIYLDFMMIYSRESFIDNYSKAIISKQSSMDKTVRKIATLVKGFRPVMTFDDSGKPLFSVDFVEDKLSDSTIEEIIDLPEKLASDSKRYIIIMDEFQEITKLNGENFENLLRSKLQRQKKVNYLFLGSRTHLLQDMFMSKNRAFYNSAMTLQLDKIPIKDSISFLQNKFEKFNIKISDEIAKYLIEKADNIPYYIQFLAAEVWQMLVTEPKEVSAEIIDNCAAGIIDLKSDYYYSLFDNQTAYQKKLLKAIAVNGTNIFSEEYRKLYRLSAGSTTQKAIKSLLESVVIEKQGSEYFISDPFFRKYIQNYA
ncbi:MAG: ATP-binding protein [Candidatus Kapabacteria bacterium]|nr:ATP-binding protein [Candidatus Kapabacteria bacterium]